MQSCLDIIPEHTKRVLVAFSGGLDSSVLLDLLVDRGPEFEIVPWHINHGLHDAASAMEAFCVNTEIERKDALGCKGTRT